MTEDGALWVAGSGSLRTHARAGAVPGEAATVLSLGSHYES